MTIVEGDADSDGNVTSLVATAILLPESFGSDAEIEVTLSDGSVLSASMASEEFTAGYIKTFDVSIGTDKVWFTESSLKEWIESEENEGTLYTTETATDTTT